MVKANPKILRVTSTKRSRTHLSCGLKLFSVSLAKACKQQPIPRDNQSRLEQMEEDYFCITWKQERNQKAIANGKNVVYPQDDLFIVKTLENVPWYSSCHTILESFLHG